MPLYKTRSGELVTRTPDYVAAFPEGAFTKVKNESPSEARERERLEALEKKVDIEEEPAPRISGATIKKEGKH